MNARDPHALRQRLRLYWVMDGNDHDPVPLMSLADHQGSPPTLPW